MDSTYQDAVETTFKKLKIMKEGFLLERANNASSGLNSFMLAHYNDVDWIDSVRRSELDRGYFKLLQKTVSTFLKQNKALPPPLFIWLTEVLDGVRTQPKSQSKPGRPQKIRNEEFYIAGLINFLIRNYNLNLSRNISGIHKRSACDALEDAISKLYQETKYQIKPNSYDGLLKLFQRHRKAVLGLVINP